MGSFSRLNRFIEEKLKIHSYSLKVVLLFASLILVSMAFALIVDIMHSVEEVRNEIRHAAERAAKFRTTAIRSVVLGIFQADVGLAGLLESSGEKAIEPFLNNFATCVRGENLSLGDVKESFIKEALGSSHKKRLYFHLFPEDWLGVAVVRLRGNTYAFCHKVPYIESILSKKLGAIAKYGAEFYFGKRPQVSEGDILVVYENDYSNASMFVVVPFRNVVRTLVAERVFLYIRLYFVFILFLTVSYLLWARFINYPIDRLKEVVGELERGNYDVNFMDMLSARDEFGGIARLLKSFSDDTRMRLDKLELILDTALISVNTPEEVPSFIRSTLSRINRIFGARFSLFLVEELDTHRFPYLVGSDELPEEEVNGLIEIYREKARETEHTFEEPICVKEKGDRGCLSMVLFKVERNVQGAVIFSMEREIDSINESYLKVVCQHIFGTIRLTYLATTDYLTGIPNRRVLENDMRSHGRLARRYEKPLSLIMCDIDNFKGVNDTYGHEVGDEVLKSVAKLIRSTIRETDIVYRYGGEEFAVLCPETDKAGAYEVAERIREVVRDTKIQVDRDRGIYITVSVGVANFPEDTTDPNELLAVADIALYRAKSEGKDRTATLTGSSDRELFTERFRREKELREFIKKGSTVHHLQPVYDLESGRVFGYELLFRVADGEKLYPMGMFIDYVEDLGLLEDIDRLTVGRVSELLRREDMTPYCFFVNVSPRSLERGKIFTELNLIPKHLRPRLHIEITEQETFLNMDKALTHIERLRNMGFHVVLDDFGKGFSSMSQLRSLVKFLSFIKVDGTFVRNVHRDPYNRAILEGIKTMADRFSLDLIAEFIETEEEMIAVKSIGIRYGQGYYFGKESQAIA
ncbi:putative bifunctional diguanylate cyclase/phosphodiesterase [Hydrogenivirga sp.]